MVDTYSGGKSPWRLLHHGGRSLHQDVCPHDPSFTPTYHCPHDPSLSPQLISLVGKEQWEGEMTPMNGEKILLNGNCSVISGNLGTTLFWKHRQEKEREEQWNKRQQAFFPSSQLLHATTKLIQTDREDKPRRKRIDYPHQRSQDLSLTLL